MNEKNDVVQILILLKQNNIRYILLRDYKPVENITVSLDVDIFIEKKYKKQVDKILKQQGWYTPRINAARFPHKQYIKLSDKIIQKIDIVFGLYFGNELYKLNDSVDVFKNKELDNGVYIPSDTVGAILIILHVIFDKSSISDKNFELIKLINTNKISNDIIKKIVYEIQEKGIVNSNKDIRKYKQVILQNHMLSYSTFRKIMRTIIQKVNYKIDKLIKILSRNSICFIGVDGTGKSTYVSKVSTIMSDKFATIQYMGYKNYEIECLNGEINKFSKYFLIYINQLYRFLKTRFSCKMTIYDRYVDEAYINSKGIKKLVNCILYKILFPKPKLIIYLYCDVNTSLNRKDDIKDITGFRNMKVNFDRQFLNTKKVKKIKTDEMSEDDTLKVVIEILNNNILKYLI